MSTSEKGYDSEQIAALSREELLALIERFQTPAGTIFKRFHLDNVKARDLAQEIGVGPTRIYQVIKDTERRLVRLLKMEGSAKTHHTPLVPKVALSFTALRSALGTLGLRNFIEKEVSALIEGNDDSVYDIDRFLAANDGFYYRKALRLFNENPQGMMDLYRNPHWGRIYGKARANNAGSIGYPACPTLKKGEIYQYTRKGAK